MIVEGVRAVIILEKKHQLAGQVYLQLFEQFGVPGNQNVKFDGELSGCLSVSLQYAYGCY